MELTERQQREVDYHREHARTQEQLLERPFSYEVLLGGRWWNAYWKMFAHLKAIDLRGKRVLVVGCGPGQDALRLAKLGAEVHAFDLSPELIDIARRLAKREGLTIDFTIQPAESLTYPAGFFDIVVARDILHHVDIPQSVAEMRRVSGRNAVWVIDEIYSHSITNRIRYSRLVERLLYPAMQRFVYETDKPYITEDERKLSEADMRKIAEPLKIVRRSYFCLIVQRVIPDKWPILARLDRLLLTCLGGLGGYLAGRVLLIGSIKPSSRASKVDSSPSTPSAA